MQHYRIKITEQAKEHLKQIKKYIANELGEPQIAKQIISLIRMEITSLLEMPERIPLIEEMPWRDLGFRKIKVKNYYVYFWIDKTNNIIHVVAVIYVRRDQKRQLGKLNGNSQ